MGEPLHRRTLNHERRVHSHHARARVALRPVFARVHGEEQSHLLGVRACCGQVITDTELSNFR
jgi:hypothetical protein